jgi:uncharacterized protein (TIGR03382 family)
MKATILLAVCFAAGSATAGVIDFDFESTPEGAIPGDSLTLSSQGVDVTFNATGLQIRDFDTGFGNAGHVLSSFEDAGPIEVLFSQAVQSVSFENVINGRYTSEVDFIDGVAYDAGNNIVDSFSGNASDFPTLSGAGIVRVTWVESEPGQGFVVDNVSFVVPGPATLSALGLALGAGLRRRRA